MHNQTVLFPAILGMLATCALGASSPPVFEPVGGANAPTSSPPPALLIGTAELRAEGFMIRVPTGEYTSPVGGAPNYRVPGPIVSFKGTDGVWRGHGYLETYARLKSFRGEVAGDRATLKYAFENDERYEVTMKAAGAVVTIEENSTLGTRNAYVFDAYYNWEPSSAFVLDLTGEKHAFLYLPCHYDKVEANMTPSTNTAPLLGAVAVVHPDPSKKDVAAFFVRAPDDWRNPDRMTTSLWQRRQLPGDPSSRHFLGPETKSDSTPNPRTAALLGKSLYEGHVTIEHSLGTGKRLLGFTVYAKPSKREDLPQPLRETMAHGAGTP
jgi:hypothetical protein